jgi:5-methylcytosine-specific restriction protein A
LEEVVWKEFAHDQARLQATADTIRAYVVAGNVPSQPGVADQVGTTATEDFEAPEGALLTREHVSRERNRRLVEQKKQVAMEKQGSVACEVCGFDFGKVYGERGVGFAECHHTTPLSSLKPGAKTKLEDLSLLCANCHRMVHVRKPWLAVAELQTMLARSWSTR